MYSATFEIESFDVIPIACRCALVIALTEALASINLKYLRFARADMGDFPPLYQSGVRYGAQTMGRDKWRDIPRLLETKRGACEDLAAWRVAELRVAGYAAHIDVDTFEMPNGSIIYHVVVVRDGGVREDPSAVLGMSHATQTA